MNTLKNKRMKWWKDNKEVMMLAIPAIMQGVISSSLGLVNSIMLNKTSETVMVVTGLVNQYLIGVTLILSGVAGGCWVFIAQFLGQKNYVNIKKTISLTLIINLLIVLPFVFVSSLFPEFAMKIFTDDPEMLKIGGEYLTIILYSLIPLCITTVFGSVLRALQQIRLTVVASVVSLISNTILNYILIFGKFGFPEMGYRGAAIATLVARTIECIFLLIFFKKYIKGYFSYGIKDIFTKIDKVFAKTFIRTTSHLTINDWLYGMATTIYYIAYSHQGVEALAALNIAGAVQGMTFVVITGYSTAVGVVIGKLIGANKLDLAYTRSDIYLKNSFIMGLICGILLLIISPFMVNLYDLSTVVESLVYKLIIVYAMFMGVRFVNFLALCAVFRSGGDTRWVMLLELICIWGIAVPCAFIGVDILHLDMHLVVALVMLEEIVKFVLIIPRFKSKKWIKRIQL